MMNWNPPHWVPIYLMILKNQKFSKIFGSEIFFCFTIHKKLNKSCSFEKNFLFLKKKFVSLKKKFFWNFMKWGLKGGISIYADSGPPRYVLWCCGGICHEVLTFIQIGCGHTVFENQTRIRFFLQHHII